MIIFLACMLQKNAKYARPLKVNFVSVLRVSTGMKLGELLPTNCSLCATSGGDGCTRSDALHKSATSVVFGRTCGGVYKDAVKMQCWSDLALDYEADPASR